MMPPGKYYIGDLCYVIRDQEWQDTCELAFPDEGGTVEGEFTMKSGKRYAEFRTAYGDGVYYTNLGHRLPVDSGGIGCIKVEDIDMNGNGCHPKDGAIVDFDKPFEPETDGDGHLSFGHITVNTKGDDEDEDDEDYVDDCDDEEENEEEDE